MVLGSSPVAVTSGKSSFKFVVNHSNLLQSSHNGHPCFPIEGLAIKWYFEKLGGRVLENIKCFWEGTFKKREGMNNVKRLL